MQMLKRERNKMKKLSSSNLKNKLKLPNKVLRECNSVDHIEVPRKLRSAMKKRNSGSVSPLLLDKKKQKRAINEIRFADDVTKKKLQVNRSDESEITKDEEEAVETLFSLAQMFHNKNKSGTEAKSPLLENKESAPETLEIKSRTKQSSTVRTVNLKPSLVSVRNNFESEPTMIKNSKQLADEEPVASERKPKLAAPFAEAVGSLPEQKFTTENIRSIGLWPGLPSHVSFGGDAKGSSANSLAADNPTLMSLNPLSTQPSSSANTMAEMDLRNPFVRNKSWKRCLAHAHISHLVKGLQAAENTSNMAEDDGSKQEARIDKSVSEIPVTEKYQNENRRDILFHKLLVQDQQQPSPAATLYTSNKQTVDFLSLSTGSGGIVATKTAARTGNMTEPWGPFHIPYLQSISQNYANIPFSLPQSRYFTPPFSNHFPASAAKQVHTQLQSYPSSTILAPSEIQHQQRIWASQFASQYKPMGLSFSPNNPTTAHGLQPMYIPLSPQRHNLLPLSSSLPNSSVKISQSHCINSERAYMSLIERI